MFNLFQLISISTLITTTNAFFRNIGKTIISKTNQDVYREWWADPRIHTLGNFGPMGEFHSTIAPYITKHIDDTSYNGENIRLTAAKIIKTYKTDPTAVLDLGCGTGMSTEALHSVFPNTAVAGIDTSPSMLKTAINRNLEFINKPYYFKNKAHDLSLIDNSVDIITCMFTLHETPLHGIIKILNEMDRVNSYNGIIAIVDIAPEYKPSFWMEIGEPYIRPYLANIDFFIEIFANNTNRTLSRQVLVEGHVILWLLIDDRNL